ncbi:diguanylate cyclase [Heliobacterium chlorum]|uniref:Diguanylate cyclase n=1 Tax=Heliobacterium chlorum TaxID=2698 RepID=A0ABR7T813_HELCL|nr:diguanylate cyclase [Heliobacterium chlorum]MBC9786372.1 diguanylate cyclase [Heliobacterium chlorum]
MHSLASLASPEMYTLQGEALLINAVAIMHEKNISSILVTRGDVVVGIITERDLVRLVASGVDLRNTTAESVMTTRLVHLPETAVLDEVLFVMEQEGIRHLVVTEADEQGRQETLLEPEQDSLPGQKPRENSLPIRAGEEGIPRAKGIVTYTDIVRKLEEDFFKKPLTVQDCMTTDLHRVDVTTTIGAAFAKMSEERLGCLLIDQQGKTVGILTERDVVRFTRRDLDLQCPVVQVMSPSPMTISQDMTLFDAARYMEQHRIRRLLVRNRDGRIGGMIDNNHIVQAVKNTYHSFMQGEVMRSRKVLTMIDEGVAEIDGRNYRVLWMNPAGARLLGFETYSEALGREFTSLIDPEAAERMFIDFRDQTARDGVTGVTALPTSGAKHLLLAYQIYRDFRGEPRIRIIYRDITELATAKDALHAEKERIQTIFNASREGMLILDGAGKVLEHNHRALEILGLMEKSAQLRNSLEWEKYAEICDEQGRRVSLENLFIGTVLESGQAIYDRILRITFRDDGRTMWLMASAVPIPRQRYVVLTYFDVTASKQKEMEIRRSEKKFRTLFQNLTEAVILLEPSGKVVDLNPAARGILRVTEDLPLPLPLGELDCTFLDKDGNPLQAKEIASWERSSQKAPMKDQVIGIVRGEKTHWGILNQTPTFGEDGTVESVIVTFTDLTEYMESKRQEEVLLACSLDLTRAMTEEEVYSILEHYLRRLRRGNGRINAVMLRAVAGGDTPQMLIHWVEEGLILHRNNEHNLNWCKAYVSGVDLVVKDALMEYGCPCQAMRSESGSYFCTNLSVGGQVVGILHIYSKMPGFFDEQSVRMIRGLLALAAPTISNMRLIEHNRHLSLIDPLTGLHNRRYLEQVLESMLIQARERNESFCLLMSDIDQFKKFNDTYGHDAGDNALRMVAANVKNCLREGDIAVRFGGEEVTIVLNHVNKEMAMTIAERIRRRIEQTPIDIGDGHLEYVTLSIGVAAFPQDGKTIDKLIQRADVALYEAKRLGKNRVAGFQKAPEKKDAEPRKIKATKQ